MPQKLFTIYLTEAADEDRGVQDLLREYLDTGWEVVSVTPVGSGIAGSENTLTAWFAVVLQYRAE
ncbi:MAG: hypothetical protein ACJ8F7_15050 [Gemmataceae bacterium]